MGFSMSIQEVLWQGEEWCWWHELPLWQSRHSHCSPHLTPARQHSQQFLRHDDFLQVHLRAGTKAGTPWKWPGLRQLATCCAWQMRWQLPGWFWQPVQMQLRLQRRPLAKHQQQSLRQSIFEHLQPGCSPSPYASPAPHSRCLATATAESGDNLLPSPSSSNSQKRSFLFLPARQSSSMRRRDVQAKGAAVRSSLMWDLNIRLQYKNIEADPAWRQKSQRSIMSDQKLKITQISLQILEKKYFMELGMQ